MNANDLADRLEEFYKGTHIQKAAEELRRLYKLSHLVKELTDFEIMQISSTYPDRLYFARAILRKAQEK